MPHAEEALREIGGAQIPVGAVSNAVFSGETLRLELEKHRLAAVFDFVLSSADLRVRKPDARIFEKALAGLGVAAASTWFVGDSWEHDIRGAVGVEMQAVWLSHSDAPNSDVPHQRVENWEEFFRLYRSVQ